MPVTNGVSFTGSLTVFNPTSMASAVARSVTDLLFNQSGDLYIQGTLSVAITATEIPLGGLTNPHWAFFMNHDADNYVKIRNGETGEDLVRLYPGECAFLPLELTAEPWAIADTAACDLEYLIFQR